MATYIKPEAIKDASLPIGKVAAMSEDERLAFLVSLGLGKIGVVSQKQTWASDYSGYTISDIVRGFIPQEFINNAVSLGIVYNDESGYFELNGLTDLTYNDTNKIIAAGRPHYLSMVSAYINLDIRTHLPIFHKNLPNYGDLFGNGVSNNINMGVVALNSNIEVFCFFEEEYSYFNYISNQIVSSFKDAKKLQKAYIIPAYSNIIYHRTFDGCFALRELKLHKINKNLSLNYSSFLTNESILYIINNEAATSAITVTLHKDAYARAMADAEIQTALEAHPNISLASA